MKATVLQISKQFHPLKIELVFETQREVDIFVHLVGAAPPLLEKAIIVPNDITHSEISDICHVCYMATSKFKSS